jgi:mercuric ion binding protein
MFKYFFAPFLTLIFALSFSSVFAQSQPDKNEVKFKTSAQCDMCKKRIEKVMSMEKGVKSAVLDVDSKILTINYKADKTDVATLKKSVSKIGYDADEVKADEKAHNKLPACCQKGGHDDKDGHK